METNWPQSALSHSDNYLRIIVRKCARVNLTVDDAHGTGRPRRPGSEVPAADREKNNRQTRSSDAARRVVAAVVMLVIRQRSDSTAEVYERVARRG